MTVVHPVCSPSKLGRSGALAIALLSVLLVDCSKSVDQDADQSAESASASGEPRHAGPPGVVELARPAQQRLSLRVEPLTAMTALPELKGYGRVLDPGPLAALVTELATAQATASASAQEFARLQSLQADNNASTRALQAAEATAVRDRWLVQSARDRMALAWGRILPQRTDLPTLVEALTSQERLIVRIDLPAGEPLSSPSDAARLVGLADETRSTSAEFLSLAPATDPQMQGEGLLYLTRDNSLHLSPEAAVIGYLALRGTPLHGVLLPRSAVLRQAGNAWVYLQTDDTDFRRVAVALTQPTQGGWLIPEGLKPGDRVVTDGAQLLLSEELRSQLSLGD